MLKIRPATLSLKCILFLTKKKNVAWPICLHIYIKLLYMNLCWEKRKNPKSLQGGSISPFSVKEDIAGYHNVNGINLFSLYKGYHRNVDIINSRVDFIYFFFSKKKGIGWRAVILGFSI